MTESHASRFSNALRALLDDTDYYDRESWSHFLFVSPDAIDQWLSDKAVPRPDTLRMMLDLLRLRGGAAASVPLATFEALQTRPAAAISPLGERFGATLADYLQMSVLDFAGTLRGLSGSAQQAALQGEAEIPT